MSIYGDCGNIYNTDQTRNDLCNVTHYRGKEPYGNYNALGELTGYFWYYGETIRLNFTIDGSITTDHVDGEGNPIYINPEDYLAGKTAKVQLFNFRYEEVYSTLLPASTNLVIDVDEETSSKIIRGDYYLTLKIVDETSLVYIALLKDKECIITVR